jgi:DNA polymerase gamma 1
VRDSFIQLSLAELRQDIPRLLDYCAGDVMATLEVTRVLAPRFLQSCPHPVTLAGMLIMSNSYLPTNTCWNR